MDEKAREQLNQVARELASGQTPPSVTVRTFLSWFVAQRRGLWIVERIREALREAGLQTVPDFESAYIDSHITFALRASEGSMERQPASPATAPARSSDGTESSPISAATNADPTHRISKLAAANNPPLFVAPDATLQQAVTLMLEQDFSQLPVMNGPRDVKGLITWKSIGSRLFAGKSGRTVRDFMEPSHQEIRDDASLFDVIPIVIQSQCVLVRGSEGRIKGIVTASDLSVQFRQLSEPFLLLSEIENQIRRIIRDRFSREELQKIRDPADGERGVESIDDLSIGEYLRLIERSDNWARLRLPIDRVIFCQGLDRVRKIRNAVMHFDPDGPEPEDLEALRRFARFLKTIQEIGPS